MSPMPSVSKLNPNYVAAPPVNAIIKPPATDYKTPNVPTAITPYHGIGDFSE